MIVMFIGSAVAGGIWGGIPAVFKAKWGANETLFTLMMNYIAIQLTSFFVALWEHPFGSNSVGIINPTTKSGWFPPIFGQAYTLNVIIVLALTVLMFVYLKYTKHGYEIAVVGESENTARYAAINVRQGHHSFDDHLRRHLRHRGFPRGQRSEPHDLDQHGGADADSPRSSSHGLRSSTAS